MALAGKITEYELTYEGTDYKVFSKPNTFVPYIGSLPEKGAVNPVPVTQNVTGHTRKRWPGDSGVSVSGFSRKRLTAGEGVQRTLPGETFTIEEKIGTGSSATTKVVSVTTTAPFYAFFDYCQQEALKDFTLRSAEGTPYPIEAAAAGP